MFNKFKSKFIEYLSVENRPVEMKNIPFKYSELLLDCGGKSYDKGLYTIHTFEESIKWTNLLGEYFEKYQGEILAFGHDWLGRQFCVPTRSNECILVFDPATQQDFHMDENLLDFHNNFLFEKKEQFFSSDTFKSVLTHLQIKGLDYNRCIGLKTSLFLGGNEELSNYESSDLEVYWDIEFQISTQVKGMPKGTVVSKLAINPIVKKKK